MREHHVRRQDQRHRRAEGRGSDLEAAFAGPVPTTSSRRRASRASSSSARRRGDPLLRGEHLGGRGVLPGLAHGQAGAHHGGPNPVATEGRNPRVRGRRPRLSDGGTAGGPWRRRHAPPVRPRSGRTTCAPFAVVREGRRLRRPAADRFCDQPREARESRPTGARHPAAQRLRPLPLWSQDVPLSSPWSRGFVASATGRRQVLRPPPSPRRTKCVSTTTRTARPRARPRPCRPDRDRQYRSPCPNRNTASSVENGASLGLATTAALDRGRSNGRAPWALPRP